MATDSAHLQRVDALFDLLMICQRNRSRFLNIPICIASGLHFFFAVLVLCSYCNRVSEPSAAQCSAQETRTERVIISVGSF